MPDDQPGARRRPEPEDPAVVPHALRHTTRATPFYRCLRAGLESGHTVLDMDPVRNPYAPGAGQRPPELAGRDTELSARSTSSWSGSRTAGPSARWCSPGCAGSARPCCSTSCARRRSPAGGAPARSRPARTSRCAGRCPPRCTWRCASWARGTATRSRSRTCSASSRRSPSGRRRPTPRCATAGSPASTCPAATGRADSGDMEIDLVELLSDAAGVAADIGSGIALFIDEMQDVQPDDVSRHLRRLPRALPAGRAADRRRRRAAAPARGPQRVQELLRAAVPLPADRPARPDGRRPRAARPGRAGGRRLRRRRRWTPSTPPPTATPTSCRPTARSPGTSPPPPRSPPTTSRWPHRSPRPSSPCSLARAWAHAAVHDETDSRKTRKTRGVGGICADPPHRNAQATLALAQTAAFRGAS